MNINIGAFAIRTLSPWFNPRQEKDPEWMKQWLKGYNTLAEGKPIPLVDTEHATIPVPF